MKPNSVNICGITYTITYVDKPSDVDINHYASLWGQIDYWTRTIRIYDDGKRPVEDLWETVIHEVLHGIGNALHLKDLEDAGKHDDLDILAMALADTFIRNGWLKVGDDG